MSMMATYVLDDRNQDATVYVGNLDEKVTETTLWELFLQGGPVVSVHLPKDRVSYLHQGFGFVEFVCEEDADYCIKIMNMIKLYGKPIRVNKASTHQKNLDVGANIFVGNLDTEVDEKLLYDTFSAFGVILQTPKIMRDYQMGTSKGFAFINYGTFDASDAAIEAMNGQFLCNRPITVSYAYKKDSRGERHGSAAERILAMQNPLSLQDKPHQKFADAPPNPSAAAPPTRMPFPPGAQGANAPYIQSQQISADASQNMQMFPPPPPMGHMPPPPIGHMPPPPIGHMPPPPIGHMPPPPMGQMQHPPMGHMPPPPMGHMPPQPMGQMPRLPMGQMSQPQMGQRPPPYSIGGGPLTQPFQYPPQQDYRMMNMYPSQPPPPPSK